MHEIPEHVVAQACSHPLRSQILRILADQPRSPKSVADELGEPLGNVSYHFQVLQKLDAITLVGEEPRRGAVEHFYTACWRAHVRAEPLA
ncbi:MAG: helix-turn-helix transcriptional regulator [Polyangiaceae bacterium]|nr:helix-turn-helix transcriptional regulator [Polyangiaceae bacterium]